MLMMDRNVDEKKYKASMSVPELNNMVNLHMKWIFFKCNTYFFM